MTDQAVATAPAPARTGPRFLFSRLAALEAVTWALLLTGMFLKYVTETTELGVRIFGMFHGVVFIAYCLVAVLTSVDQKWPIGRVALALVSAVVPFMTVWFTARVEPRAPITHAWRLRNGAPGNALERAVAWLLRNPLLAVVLFVVALAALTGLALAVGPPAG